MGGAWSKAKPCQNCAVIRPETRYNPYYSDQEGMVFPPDQVRRRRLLPSARIT